MTKRSISDVSVWLGALALASLLWFHAVTEHHYRRRLEIPLQVSDPAPSAGSQEIVVANSPPAEVTVLVSGRGKDLLRLGEGDLLLRLQPPRGRAGARVAYRLEPGQVESQTELPVRVEEIVSPVEVEVVLDRKADREVPVRSLVELRIADSYTQVGEMRLDPATVRISGPRRAVEAVRSIATDTLILEGVREDIERQIALRPPEDSRIDLSHTQVRIAANVQEVAEYTVANVPVEVRGSGGESLSLEPSRVAVRIRGGADVIYDLDPEQSLRLYVDYRVWLEGGEDKGRVLAVADSFFEVREIIPSTVNIAPR